MTTLESAGIHCSWRSRLAGVAIVGVMCAALAGAAWAASKSQSIAPRASKGVNSEATGPRMVISGMRETVP